MLTQDNRAKFIKTKWYKIGDQSSIHIRATSTESRFLTENEIYTVHHNSFMYLHVTYRRAAKTHISKGF